MILPKHFYDANYSYAVIPHCTVRSMPKKWQKKYYRLMNELEEQIYEDSPEYHLPFNLRYRVTLQTLTGKIASIEKDPLNRCNQLLVTKNQIKKHRKNTLWQHILNWK